jgi:hypothetical protein
MHTLKSICLLNFFVFISFFSIAQTTEDSGNKMVYTKYVSEFLFQFSETETISNKSQLNGVKTSILPNFGAYTHINFNNNIGIIPALSIRNVGMKTYNDSVNSVKYDLIKRRALLLGGSLALKLGSFSKHAFLYGGAEYEMSIHVRQKLYDDSQHQAFKQGEWFSTATERFLPSAFIGFQFPNGYNIQAKYYLNNFLNHNYSGALGDFTNLKTSQVFYISVSFQFKESDPSLKEKIEEKKDAIDL